MQQGILFQFTENGVEGFAKDKKIFCVTTRGNDYSVGTYMNQFDIQEPYLRAIFGLAGISDITFINAQPVDIATGLNQASLDKAREQVSSIINHIEFLVTQQEVIFHFKILIHRNRFWL